MKDRNAHSARKTAKRRKAQKRLESLVLHEHELDANTFDARYYDDRDAYRAIDDAIALCERMTEFDNS